MLRDAKDCAAEVCASWAERKRGQMTDADMWNMPVCRALMQLADRADYYRMPPILRREEISHRGTVIIEAQ
jgi:hypothetical protein